MFDIGWSELLVIAVVAIIVVGPKDLPKMMRGIGLGVWDTITEFHTLATRVSLRSLDYVVGQ